MDGHLEHVASLISREVENFTDYFEVFGFTGINLDTTAAATALNPQHLL